MGGAGMVLVRVSTVSDTSEWVHFHFSLSCIGEGNSSPLQCPCLENPRDGEPGGLPSVGLHWVGDDWSDSAATAAAVSVSRFLLQRRVSYILCFRCINDWALHHNSWPNVNISLLQSHLCCCWLAKSCPILCNPLDCSSPGSSVMS